MSRKVMLLAVALVLASSMAVAQEGLLDRNEVQASAAWAEISDFSVTLLAAHYGRFVSPNLQAQLGLLWADLDYAGSDINAFGIAPAVAWHFIGEETTNVVPYIGVGWYFLSLSNSSDIDESGLEAFVGAKFFIGGDYMTSNRAVFLEYRYLSDVFDESINTVMVGITNFF